MREPRTSVRHVFRAAVVVCVAGAASPLAAQEPLFHFTPLALGGPSLAKNAAEVGDVDGDGVGDLLLQIVAFFTPPGGAATTLHSGKTQAVLATYAGGPIAGLGDVDGDGTPDFIAGGSVHSLRNGVLSAVSTRALAVAGLGDIDGDGRADYASVTDEPSPSGVQRWINVVAGNSGMVIRRVLSGSQGTNVFVAKTRDFDGDGLSDIAEFDRATLVVRSSAMMGVMATVAEFATSFAVLHDVDGDGLDDFLFGNPNGAQGRGTARVVSTAQGGQVVMSLTGGTRDVGFGSAVCELRTNGFPDFAVATVMFGGPVSAPGVVYVFSSFDRVLLSTIPNAYPNLSAGLLGGQDYDRDGQPDLVAIGLSVDGYGKIPGALYYQTIGNGCPGSHGRATLSAAAPPRVGVPFTLTVSNLPPSGPVTMLVGLSARSIAGIPLPLSLGSIGMPGCSLLTSGDLGFPLFNGGGQATWSFVPQPFTVGVHFTNQAVIWDPPANPLGLVLSDAGSGRIGN